MENIVIGKSIAKTFHMGAEQVKALDSVNTEIKRGEFVAVMGPSGSGKTTLLHALSGMDSITGGSVKFKDTELSKLRDNELADIRRTKMGFIFQQPTMLKNMNLLDNIILPAVCGGKNSARTLTQKAKTLMQKMGIGGLEYRDTAEVSGGQLARAGICRALVNDPEILFADEPTGALNSKSAEEIMKLLVEISQKGTAILLVTHDMKVAAKADRVIFMKDGSIVTDLSLQKFCGNDMESRTEKVLAKMAAVGI